MTAPSALQRRFEAIVLDWRGDREVDAPALGALIEAGCELGLELAIVSGIDPADVDRWLGARPRGPGALHLAVSPGSQVYVVDAEGMREVNATGTDSARWLLDELWRRGIGLSQVLECTDGPGSLGGTLGGGSSKFAEILGDQLTRRRRREPPSVADEPGWSLTFARIDPLRERTTEALLTLGDGRTGTRGSLAIAAPESAPGLRLAGVYRGDGPETELLPGPLWNLVASASTPRAAHRRLDLHSATLWQHVETDSGGLEAVTFASLARPGTMALRAGAAPGLLSARQGLVDPAGDEHLDSPALISEPPGSIAAALVETQTRGGDGDEHFERLAGYAWSPDGDADTDAAVTRVGSAARAGYERVLQDHRRAWAARWEVSDVRIDGDDELQLAVRLALYHLMASTPTTGEGPVGARGLTGSAYRGHVFWDADAYVLPFHAATHPACARAMLEYRLARLPAALHEAHARGRAGARFPWESAHDGREVTPTAAALPTGEVVAIRTGELEDHIAADVAWAAGCYTAWTGDARFASGPGRELLLQTARYWAARVVIDAGRAHIRGVIGPDEYHEGVDDNAYTNVMARWNLRAAARAGDHASASMRREAEHWRDVAEAMVDGYDATSGRYEQFAGFYRLEPLIIAELAARPVAAPVLLGADRVAQAQVVKQADVLMLHYLVPEEVAAGSLAANLAYYEPRTAHGSTLSPGVHAALLARAGRPEDALQWLRLTARIDLDDTSATTAGGVHLAAMGGVWRALSWGFAGVSPGADAVVIDPRPLPASWRSIEVGVRYRGTAVRVRVLPGAVDVIPVTPIDVVLAATGRRERIGPAGRRLPIPDIEGQPR